MSHTYQCPPACEEHRGPRCYERYASVVISILPEDFSDVCPDSRYHWELAAEWRGGESYAVTHGRRCLGADGTWDWEGRSPEQSEEWLATYRFTLGEAIRLAHEHAPHVSVNGHPATEVLQEYLRRKEGTAS